MHICQMTSVHPRDDARIFHKISRSLSQYGHRVSVVVADGLSNGSIENISIIDAGKPASRIHRMLFATRRVYQKALRCDADIFHFHDPELLPVGLMLKDLGKCVVFDAHENIRKQLLSKPYLNPSLLRWTAWAYDKYESSSISRLDAVIAATPCIRDIYAQAHQRVEVINNFPLLGELASPIPWDEREAAVCYVGGICRIRGIIEVVEAMQHVCGDTRLHLVGKFTDSEILVRKSPGFEHVQTWGVVGRAGVREAMSRSMAGIVTFHPAPNHIDAQPNKMFEYMSAGIPVIASNFPLWREIIDGNRCGICVDPLDPMAIATAINSLIADPAMAQEMGANGRRAVLEKFNWGVEEKKLLALYESLA